MLFLNIEIAHGFIMFSLTQFCLFFLHAALPLFTLLSYVYFSSKQNIHDA